MRFLPLIVVLLLSVGCQHKPFLMRGGMTMNGDMRMNGDMNMNGDMDMSGDMSMSMKTDNTASRLASVLVTGHPNAGQKVAVVDVDGLLLNQNISGLGSMGENPVALFREKINAIAADASVGAVVLRINSPGGGVNASDLMAHEVTQLKRKRNLPVVACLMGTGTGGGYYLATHADTIISHPTSVVGGIGVILNVYDMENTMGQFNITAQHIKAGDKIDAGSPERVVEEDEREMLQNIADSFQKRFIDQVKLARGDIQTEVEVFDGSVFTGVQAQQLNLVDQVGYLDEAIDRARELCGAAPDGPVVMLRRDNDRAYTTLDVSPNDPLGMSLLPINIPGLDRSAMPTFLYLWQADPSLAAVIQ
ncbi:S49 family peptidase [Planctomycetes bacterium K23_9]|uniref:Signal peptide peptidase SppA n=1 Tax=Stieleria marina TaxID=1930275 RepID=A0A517NZB1_9BACT|nr:Putative signal peptide peptidase SppA [Planctomycetes bacterium K23_9]